MASSVTVEKVPTCFFMPVSISSIFSPARRSYNAFQSAFLSWARSEYGTRIRKHANAALRMVKPLFCLHLQSYLRFPLWPRKRQKLCVPTNSMRVYFGFPKCHITADFGSRRVRLCSRRLRFNRALRNTRPVPAKPSNRARRPLVGIWKLSLGLTADCRRMTGNSEVTRLGKVCRPSGSDLLGRSATVHTKPYFHQSRIELTGSANSRPFNQNPFLANS